MSVAGTVTPRARARRARPKASRQTEPSIGSSGRTRANAFSTRFSRCPCAPFQSSSWTREHQQASPLRKAATTRPRTTGSPVGRSIWIQEDVSTRINAQPLRRAACTSSGVVNSGHVPACLTSSAIRSRRLKSAMAATTASRFVFAFVNLIASSSSRSGISIVVFMHPI